MFANYNNSCALSEVNTMPLFRRDDNKPLKFNIIDVNDGERAELTELIVDNGGETTDDEETIVKFTTQSGYGRNSYPRAKIYDIKFIFECIRESRIIDPEKFRLGKKIPEDEYCMLHFLYGDCSIRRRQILAKENSQGSTVVVSDSDDLLALLKFTQNTDAFLTSQSTNTGNAGTQIMDIDETLFNNAIKTEPLCPISHESSDNSQSVEMDGYAPLLAGGDAVVSFNDNREIQSVNSKISVSAEDARKSDATRETPSVMGKLQEQRSPRTRTRRKTTRLTNGDNTVQQQISTVTGDTKNCPSSTGQCDENGPRIPKIETISVKQENCDDSTNSNDPEKKQLLTIIPEARQRSISPPVVAATTSAYICWIPTEISRTRGNVTIIDNSGVSRNNQIDTIGSQVTSVVTSIISPSVVILPENTEIPGSSEKTKRKSDIWGKSEDEDNVDVEIHARCDFPADEIQADRGRRKQQVRACRRGANNTSFTRQLPCLRENFRSNENYDDSSDSSLPESEIPTKKRSRGELGETRFSGSSDQDIVRDANTVDEISEKRTSDRWEEAVSRNYDDNTRSCYNEDDERSGIDANSQMVIEQSHCQIMPESNNVDDEGRVERIVIAPRIEHYLPPELSRGQLWRSRLLHAREKSHQAGRFRKPFTPVERRKMLRYLIKRKCIFMAKGLVIWKEMIEDGLLVHRTPQSLQNQFQKQILPNIATAEFLSESQKKEFLALRGNGGKR